MVVVQEIALTKKKTTKKKTGKGGRPSKYTDKLAALICERVLMGESLVQITSDKSMPAARTVYYWIANNEKFLQMYTKAKEDQQETYIDELIDIADNQCSTAVMVEGQPLLIDGKPLTTVTPASVSHAKLRIETRKWTAAKLKPRKYGNHNSVSIDLPKGSGVLMTPPVSSSDEWAKLSKQANEQLTQKEKQFMKENG
jgi:hypothetical protein